MSETRALDNAGIARAALLTLFGFLASGVLGFIRTAVISAQFGTGDALDAFYAAQRLPEFIFVLVAGGALGSSFIPIYAKKREESSAEAWQLASAVMTLAALAAACLGALIALFAPFLVENILLTDSSPAIQSLTADMMRIMMLTPFIFSISGLIMGILQSHGLFLLPSVAISMNNIGLMIGALLIAPLLASVDYTALDALRESGTVLHEVGQSRLPVEQVGINNIYGLAIGAVLSAILHLVVQLPGLRTLKAKLRPLPNPSIPGVKRVLALMLPRVLGLAVVQINFVVNIVLTDGMIAGSLVALNTAFTLMFFALGIIAQSVGSAVFPTLAALHAENNMDGFKERLASAIRSVLFLSFPAMIAFIVLGEPIVSIFERGNWTSESTQATAWALGFYALGIAGFALLEIFSRAFYALEDTWTPVLAGLFAMISNIVFSLLLINIIGDPETLARGAFAGLALANAATTLIEALVLWYLMRRRIGKIGSIVGIYDSLILRSAAKALIAALIMGAVLFLLDILLPIEGLLLAIIGAAIGG
ncbi:MAG: murein biosynthesis integral membrane protein MurJ, partial [Aggregatilineales bacterium]